MDSSLLARQQLEAGTAVMSFDALNLWASKRELEISQNRIETKNSCLLNLWRQEFVIYNTAVAAGGLSPLDFLMCGCYNREELKRHTEK